MFCSKRRNGYLFRGFNSSNYATKYYNYERALQIRIFMKLVLIGCSTGGPGHLGKILSKLPVGYDACLVIVQHIGEVFLPSLVQNFESSCNIPMNICSDGTVLKAGNVYFAKGELLCEMRSSSHNVVWHISNIKSDTYAPNINNLFASVAHIADRFDSILATILTGIGDDGASGLLELKNRGAYTIAESKESAIVYGMPRSASENGAALDVLNIEQIASKIANF